MFYQIRLCQRGLKKLGNWRTSISRDIAIPHSTLLICLAVELLLVTWLMNAAFGGRILIGCPQKSGLFGALPAIKWNMRYTWKAWKPRVWLQRNKFNTVSDHEETKYEDINSTIVILKMQLPSKRKVAIEARKKIIC